MKREVYVSIVRNEFLRKSAQKFILYVRRGQWHRRDETVVESHDGAVLRQGSVQLKYLPLRHPEQQRVLYGPERNAGQQGQKKRRLSDSLLCYAEALMKSVERCVATNTENVLIT